MIKVILVVIISIQTVNTQDFLSSLDFDITTDRYDQLLECYLQRNVIKGSLLMGLQILQLDYLWTSTFNLSDPKQIYQIYPQPIHLAIMTYMNIDHSIYGELVARAIKDQPIKAVWVGVTYLNMTCDILKGFIRDVRNAVGPVVTVGVMTSSTQWDFSFNTRDGCPEVPQQYPLFYSFTQQEFKPFPGWKKAEYVRGSAINVPECKMLYDRNRINYYVQPK